MIPYGTLQGFEDYTEALGYQDPGGQRDHALLRGSISLDATYAERWIGMQAAFPQDRAWPRVDAAWPDGTAVSGIPDAVVNAAYEMAHQELLAPGSTMPVVTPGKVKRRARVEGAVDVEYARDWSNDTDLVKSMTPINTKIEGLLYGLIGTRSALPGILVV